MTSYRIFRKTAKKILQRCVRRAYPRNLESTSQRILLERFIAFYHNQSVSLEKTTKKVEWSKAGYKFYSTRLEKNGLRLVTYKSNVNSLLFSVPCNPRKAKHSVTVTYTAVQSFINVLQTQNFKHIKQNVSEKELQSDFVRKARRKGTLHGRGQQIYVQSEHGKPLFLNSTKS